MDSDSDGNLHLFTSLERGTRARPLGLGCVTRVFCFPQVQFTVTLR